MILTYYCIITMIIIAYLLGSIPSAVWIGKKYYGIDIREHGSKNAGTTNMLRVLGRRAALPVFLLDFLKGFVAVTLTEILKYDAYINDMWLINIKIIAVFAAVLGHIFPIFAGFRGGKGVATLVGAITGIYPPVVLLCFAVWVVILMMTHYVSLASIVAGCCLRDISDSMPDCLLTCTDICFLAIYKNLSAFNRISTIDYPHQLGTAGANQSGKSKDFSPVQGKRNIMVSISCQMLYPQCFLADLTDTRRIRFLEFTTCHHRDQLLPVDVFYIFCANIAAIPHNRYAVRKLEQLLQPVGDKDNRHTFCF